MTAWRRDLALCTALCTGGVPAWGAAAAAVGNDVAQEGKAVAEPLRAEVRIDPDTPPQPYSPMLFGGFLEHFDSQIYGGVYDPGSPLADDSGFRIDVLEALRELRVPVIRWPGGCFASGYHWRAGVGPERRPSDDMAWGVRESNTFGTEEFVELCRLLDCAPYICNNAGDGTIEEMRDWVEYCNGVAGATADLRCANGHAEPLGVPIWSIGNENWGGHEIGTKDRDEWARLVCQAAKAMQAADPGITLTAAALPDPQWTLPLLEEAGEYLDYISIHNYWIPNWGEIQHPTYLDCMMESEGPEGIIPGAVAVLEAAGCRGRVRIAFDEWNLRSWHHPGFPRKTVQDYDDPEVQRLVAARSASDDPTQYTMADALFSASFLNACLRHADDVGMANIAPLVNTAGPLFVHKGGVVRRTTFHALAMYARLLQSHVAATSVVADPLAHGDRAVGVVDAVATTSQAGGRWSIALVNRHPDLPAHCTVRIGDALPDGDFEATVLAGDSPDAYNDIAHPARVAPLDTELAVRAGTALLPPHSLVIVYIP